MWSELCYRLRCSHKRATHESDLEAGTSLTRGKSNKAVVHESLVWLKVAFRSAQLSLTVTTLAPCWYCSGLIVQFQIDNILTSGTKTSGWPELSNLTRTRVCA